MYLTGDSSPPLVLFFLFFLCSSVGEPTTRTQHRLSLGVELVGAISVLVVYESERCGVADMESGSGPLPHPTMTLAICAVPVLSQLTDYVLPYPISKQNLPETQILKISRNTTLQLDPPIQCLNFADTNHPCPNLK